MKPCVFLDRDGVLNRTFIKRGRPVAPRRLKDFRLLPGTAKAVRSLRAAGFTIVVATNQPDIANGLVTVERVESMHRRLRERLPLDAVMVCPHNDRNRCSCRKPKPGMLRQAARRLGIDLSRSFMVGDRWRDIVAGRDAGCYTILVDRGYREGFPVEPDLRVNSLPAAAQKILSRVARGGFRRSSRLGDP